MKKSIAIKKAAALLMSAAMVLSLAACGSGNGGAAETTAAATEATTVAAVETTAAETTAAETEAPTEAEPEYDFGGRVLRIGSYYDMAPDPSANAIEAALAERIKFVEDNYNCKIEFVNLEGDYMNDYVTSVLAGDPVVDIGYAVTNRVLPSLIEGGIAYPVSDLGVFDFNEYKWRQDVSKAGTYKGKTYTWCLKDPEIRYGIFWNKTLFEQYGLPDLYELMDNDEWTWEKFKEIAIAGNQDLDNDGTYDIVGFNARENLPWCFMSSNGATVCEQTDAGVEIDLSDPAVVEALTALQDFATTVDYDDDIDWSTESWDDMNHYFRDGKAMMCLEEFWISYSYLNNADTPMQDDWGWVPFPKGPSATDWSCYGKENGCRIMLNGIDKPEEAALIYDLITDLADTDEEWDDLMEDKLESWCDDGETVDNVAYIYNNGITNINTINGFSDLNTAVNNMFNDIAAGTTTPQTAIETYQSQIDAAIADLANHDYDAEMQEMVITEEEETEAESAAEGE